MVGTVVIGKREEEGKEGGRKGDAVGVGRGYKDLVGEGAGEISDGVELSGKEVGGEEGEWLKKDSR